MGSFVEFGLFVYCFTLFFEWPCGGGGGASGPPLSQFIGCYQSSRFLFNTFSFFHDISNEVVAALK